VYGGRWLHKPTQQGLHFQTEPHLGIGCGIQRQPDNHLVASVVIACLPTDMAGES